MACAQTTTTQLTINCNSVCTYSNNASLQTQITFNYQSNLIWATMLSNSMMSQSLASDMSIGTVTLKSGSTVTLQNVGSTFNILFTGTIVDSGSSNTFTNTQIASFTVG